MKPNRVFLLGCLIVVLVLSGVVPVMAQGDSILIWADGERAPLLAELGEAFEEEFGVVVEVQEMGLGDIRDQLLVAGPAGEGPDIAIIPHDHTGQLVANGAIVPMDLGDLAEEFLPAALNLFTYNNELWGMPYAMENIALVRNTELVPEAPATWQEVRAIAEELRASGAAEYGFLIQTGDTYHHYPILSAFGGYIFGVNEDGTFNTADIGFASEGGLAAAEWLGGMYADGLMVPNVGNDEIFAFFEAGDLAMFVTGPWFSQRIIDTGVPYSIDPLPGAEGGMERGAPFSGGQGFIISAFSESQLLAETFLLDYVATDDTMQTLFDEGGRIPAWVNVDTSSDPNIEAFIAAGENSIPMPAIPEMGAVWAAAGDAYTLISQGGDPVEAFTNAAAQIATAIETLLAGVVNSVTLVGSLQDEAGCEADWNPACEATFMQDMGGGIYTITLTLPAGDYEYKIAINGDWAENYGADGARDGANIPLSLSAETEVTFTYDHNTHIVTDSVNN